MKDTKATIKLVPERLFRNPTLKYILLVVLLVGASSIWWWQSNSKISEKATVVNSAAVRISATENIDEPDMLVVQGGRFTMGGNENINEVPVNIDTLTSFKIAKYETTVAQWQKVMGSNPSPYKGCMDCPVTGVSWDKVQTFIKKLNALSGKNYRLPTEAEWEYAARGGTMSKKFEYAGSNDVNAVAWTSNNSGSKPHPVGQKKANELGLYDMSGNVWEWCNDWVDENYYGKSLGKDMNRASIWQERVIRGGSIGGEPSTTRLAYRTREKIGYRAVGFRLASSL